MVVTSTPRVRPNGCGSSHSSYPGPYNIPYTRSVVIMYPAAIYTVSSPLIYLKKYIYSYFVVDAHTFYLLVTIIVVGLVEILIKTQDDIQYIIIVIYCTRTYLYTYTYIYIYILRLVIVEYLFFFFFYKRRVSVVCILWYRCTHSTHTNNAAKLTATRANWAIIILFTRSRAILIVMLWLSARTSIFHAHNPFMSFGTNTVSQKRL